MKKLIIILSFILLFTVNTKPSNAALPCLGLQYTVEIVVCIEVYITDSYGDVKCYTVETSFCRGVFVGMGVANINLPSDYGSTVTISGDIIITDFEFDDGSISDIIIYSGEQAVKSVEDGKYYVDYYLYEN